MDWGKVPEILEEEGTGNIETDRTSPEETDLDIWNNFPYDLEEVTDIVEEHHRPGYEEQADAFLEWAEGLTQNTVSESKAGAILKVGAYLSGIQLTYNEIIDNQSYSVGFEALAQEAMSIKESIGLQEELAIENSSSGY